MQGYGQASNDTHKRKKRIAIISISSLILVACIVAVAIGVSHSVGSGSSDGKKGSGDIKSTAKAIQAICEPAEFKETCIESLKTVQDTTDPRELIKASFNVTMSHIYKAAKRSKTLKDLAKDKSGKDALRICHELMDDSINDLKRAFEESENFNIERLDEFVGEIKVWLGGALTYQETCLDAFENTTTKAGDDMRKALKTSTELTRNALAIVNNIAAVAAASSFNFSIFKRRLLSTDDLPKINKDGFPSWVTPEKHRHLAATPANIRPNVVVAKDGSGKYTTINDALKEAPKKNPKRFVIYVKEGVYDEIVRLVAANVTLIGDGPLKTRITGKRSHASGFKTLETATFSAAGHGFIAKNIGFENTAGPEGHQAVALRVHSDSSVIFNCNIDGYQDTLYVHTHRQFYRDCTITGTIDFIFGDAEAVLQNCKLVVRKPLANQMNAVTAQGRTDPNEPSAIVLQGCTITADPAYFPVRHTIKTFLGRPWKNYSRTVIMQTHMDDFIQPEGWAQWEWPPGNTHHYTCNYVEYQNKGPGAMDLTKRVKWHGVKTAIAANEAVSYTPGMYFKGDSWVRESGVPYVPGMLPR